MEQGISKRSKEERQHAVFIEKHPKPVLERIDLMIRDRNSSLLSNTRNYYTQLVTLYEDDALSGVRHFLFNLFVRLLQLF